MEENRSLLSAGAPASGVSTSDLPQSGQESLQKLLNSEESLRYVEHPNFWTTNSEVLGAIIIIALIYFVIVIFYGFEKVGYSMLSLLLVIYVALVVGAAVTHKNRFIALTDKRAILQPGVGLPNIIAYTSLVDMSRGRNPFTRREHLEIRQKTSSRFLKVVCLDSHPDGLASMENILREYVPYRSSTASEAPPEVLAAV